MKSFSEMLVSSFMFMLGYADGQLGMHLAPLTEQLRGDQLVNERKPAFMSRVPTSPRRILQ